MFKKLLLGLFCMMIAASCFAVATNNDSFTGPKDNNGNVYDTDMVGVHYKYITTLTTQSVSDYEALLYGVIIELPTLLQTTSYVLLMDTTSANATIAATSYSSFLQPLPYLYTSSSTVAGSLSANNGSNVGGLTIYNFDPPIIFNNGIYCASPGTDSGFNFTVLYRNRSFGNR